MKHSMNPSGKLTVVLMLLTVMAVPHAWAETEDADPDATDSSSEGDTLTIDACALIKNGVQRLACYDDFANPDEARTYQSSSRSSNLPDTNPDLAGSDSENSGVMSALVDRYVAVEKAIFSFSGSFVGHRPMYILPFSYLKNANRTPESPRTGETGYDYELDNQEAKYQISFKVPLLTGLLDDRTTLWFGYTQKSFWQVYNTDDSAPFRETNYEPEVFVRYATKYDVGPGTLSAVTLGLNHESNGQSEPRSRSWNRIMASAAYSYDRWLFMLQPWFRLPEKDSDDDNEDIQEYLGYANYMAIYKWSEDRTLSLKLLNNLRSDNKTSVEIGYSFPMGDTVKGYIHYYNGYGESLIDYNERIQRFGFGIMLNDWL